MAVVIYPPTTNWSAMQQHPQQLMEQFALDGHEVYFCNKKQWTKDQLKLSYPLPNVSVVHDNKYFIRSIIPQLKRQRKKILLWVTHAKHYMFAEQYFPDAIVFDYTDDFAAWTPDLERMLMRSDLVFAASESQKEEVEYVNPLLRCELISSGSDFEEKVRLAVNHLSVGQNEVMWRQRYERIRRVLADQFPEIVADTDNAPAHTSELSFLIQRVQRKLELLSELHPYILATYLRNLEQTLSSMLDMESRPSAYKHL